MSTGSNTLWLTDTSDLVVGSTLPIAGNHRNRNDIEARLNYLVKQLVRLGIRVDGLFVDADGFDIESFRQIGNN